MSELGSGLSLDEQWDLYVDPSTGDLAFDRAGEEVRKDLAFNVGRFLREIAGDVMTEGELADIEIGVERIVAGDDRIAEVNEVTANNIINEDRLEVNVRATTVEGVDIEDVFTA